MRSLVLGTIEAALGVYYSLALQNIKDFSGNAVGICQFVAVAKLPSKFPASGRRSFQNRKLRKVAGSVSGLGAGLRALSAARR